MLPETFVSGASILKILANARRLEILNLLYRQELCVTDLYDMLDLPQANVSQHLMVLRKAGIVRFRRDGKFIYYKLAHQSLWKIVLGLREAAGDFDEPSGIMFDHSTSLSPENIDGTKVIDPVCKMHLSPLNAAFKHEHNGEWKYFCASGCLKSFLEKPEEYA